MSRLRSFVAGVAGCLCLVAAAQGAEEKAASPIGKKIENFTSNDFYGKGHALGDYKDKKVVVLAFLGTECPLAKLYAPRLAELDQKLSAKGVQFLGVDSNRQDSITEIASYARVHGIKFPILKDLNNKLADELGATRTPEVFVLDQNRVVRYRGVIDDQYGIGFAKKEITAPYLQTAIDQVLSGATVAKTETDVTGCYIGKVRETDAAAKVTYSNQVVRILNKNCVSCHRPGEIAPFAMTSYDEVSGWADMIAEVVRQQRMPPWHADPKYGHFSNDRSLPAEDKEILYQWAKAGAPEGNKADLPEPPTFVDGWQMPKDPDVIFEMAKQPYQVAAEGTVDYQYFLVDPGFTEDKWIHSIEARPGNRAVVHHIIVFSTPKGGSRDEGRRQYLVGYAPGAAPVVMPSGYAKLLPAGHELLFQVHYTPNGAKAEDISRVGIVFADPKEINHLVRTTEALNNGFTIPPGVDDFKVEANSFGHGFDTELVALFPHMHLRGKAFKYEVKYPDGKTETLLDVPRYDFGWQSTYLLTQSIPLPKGTVLHCTAHYDNSENNRNNPDPKATVRWGDQTWEEMMIGFFDVAVPVSQADIQEHRYPDFSPGLDQIAQSILGRFDLNGDGKVSKDEIPAEPPGAKLFFLTMDKDLNGVITIDEVKSALIENQKRRAAAAKPGNNTQKKEEQKPAEKKD